MVRISVKRAIGTADVTDFSAAIDIENNRLAVGPDLHWSFWTSWHHLGSCQKCIVEDTDGASKVNPINLGLLEYYQYRKTKYKTIF